MWASGDHDVDGGEHVGSPRGIISVIVSLFDPGSRGSPAVLGCVGVPRVASARPCVSNKKKRRTKQRCVQARATGFMPPVFDNQPLGQLDPSRNQAIARKMAVRVAFEAMVVDANHCVAGLWNRCFEGVGGRRSGGSHVRTRMIAILIPMTVSRDP